MEPVQRADIKKTEIKHSETSPIPPPKPKKPPKETPSQPSDALPAGSKVQALITLFERPGTSETESPKDTSPPVTKFEPKPEIKPNPIKEKVEAEIRTTEKVYLDHLNKTCAYLEKCIATLEEKGKDTATLKKMLGSYTVLKNTSQILYQKLQTESTASCFQSFSKVLNLYIDITKHYEEYGSFIADTDNKSHLRFINADFKKSNDGALLSSFLIEPVQRVPRYVLLLNELQKNTTGPEQKEIIKALDLIKVTAAKINEGIREKENVGKRTLFDKAYNDKPTQENLNILKDNYTGFSFPSNPKENEEYFFKLREQARSYFQDKTNLKNLSELGKLLHKPSIGDENISKFITGVCLNFTSDDMKMVKQEIEKLAANKERTKEQSEILVGLINLQSVLSLEKRISKNLKII